MSALQPFPPAASLALVEPDIEETVLGSILMAPAIMGELSTFKAEWFADATCRVVAEAIADLRAKGHPPTPAAVTAALPIDMEVDGLKRGQLIGALMSRGLPASLASGVLASLKDRWLRRQLASAGDRLGGDARLMGLDPRDAAREAIGALDEALGAGAERLSGSLAEVTDRALDAAAAGGGTRWPIGLQSLDEALGGWWAGSFVLIAGRPGMGKSVLGVSLLRQTAMLGAGAAFFSLEMSDDEVAARALADAALEDGGPFFGSIRRGDWHLSCTDALGVARDRNAALPLFVDASPRLGMAEIAARARRLKAQYAARGIPLAVVGIDHLGLVAPDVRYAGNKVAETGEASQACKALAKELDVCVVGLSQLSRKVEERDDKRPGLADLRWSGDLEQDADAVLFAYRPEYYLQNDPKANPADLMDAANRLELLIRKNRNGTTSDVLLWASVGHSAVRDGRGRL